MIRRILAVTLLICLGIMGTLSVLAEEKTFELNVSAAVSLKDALGDIEKAYQNKEPHVKLVFNFGSSGALQTQIEQGVPCDLFISAAAKQMDALEKEDLLLKNSRKNIVNNQLVLIVPKGSDLAIKDFTDLAKDQVKTIAIGAPDSVPAGQYALQVFKHYSIWDKIQGKTVLGTSVRAVLAYVETGNADAGVVYKTDALISDKVNVVTTAPGESHEPILYPAAVMCHAGQPKAAADFLAFMTGAEAKGIFEKYGFNVLK